MKCQMCWEALESLAPNISLKASAIFRAQALRAMLSVEVGGGFPSEISSGLAPPLSWRAGSFLRETSSSPGASWTGSKPRAPTGIPTAALGTSLHCGSLPQADLPPPEQTDRNPCFAHLCFSPSPGTEQVYCVSKQPQDSNNVTAATLALQSFPSCIPWCP